MSHACQLFKRILAKHEINNRNISAPQRQKFDMVVLLTIKKKKKYCAWKIFFDSEMCSIFEKYSIRLIIIMVHLLEFIANLGVPQGSVLGPIQLSFIMGFCE